MRYIIFDLETQNIFQEVGSSDPAALDISVGSFYDSATDNLGHEHLRAAAPE